MTKALWEEHRAKAQYYRISEDEFFKICELLGGRCPEGVEWALFSALWSEHCSYKSSRFHLKKFASTLNEKILNAQGENAGVLDLGLGERVVFKMESHNHPSFIEPFQGAATGVGGILRDIFTMGARPIALADYLCFGADFEHFGSMEKMPHLVDGVVRGISSYGNCVGVPTITGKTYFEREYDQNILVNAFALGLLRGSEKVAISKAQGVGNWVVYVGAKTGKDGVHGASMASESFDENSESKRPNVQIGDPYYEKLLIESCLEVLQAGWVVAIQDMGAAGLTSSSFEMASKGQVGLDLHLDQIPLRDLSMTPEEILLSESQERMLLICEPDKFLQIQKVFEKWGLDAVCVGQVTTSRKVQLFWKTECLTSIDPDLLVENAPLYERTFSSWTFPRRKEQLKAEFQHSSKTLENSSKTLENHWQRAIQILGQLDGCSREPIYRQYDQRVGLRTIRSAGDGEDVAFMMLPDSKRALTIALGGRPKWMRMDTHWGAMDAVIYPTLQMAVKGARLEGLTDCLNFGNPERVEIMSEFVTTVDALTEVSKIFEAPVLSGNVSFYNETLGKNIISTPAIGAVGLRAHYERIPSDFFQKQGSKVYGISWETLIADFENQEYIGSLDPKALFRFSQFLQELSFHPAVLSNRVVGQYGVLSSLIKMSFSLGGSSLSNEALGFRVTSQPEAMKWLEQDQGGRFGILYQTLWEINPKEEANFLESFGLGAIKWELKSDLKWILLGETQRDQFSLLDKQWKISDIQQQFVNGMGRIIGIMA